MAKNKFFSDAVYTNNIITEKKDYPDVKMAKNKFSISDAIYQENITRTYSTQKEACAKVVCMGWNGLSEELKSELIAATSENGHGYQDYIDCCS